MTPPYQLFSVARLAPAMSRVIWVGQWTAGSNFALLRGIVGSGNRSGPV
jgi:hypothetical protein